MMRRRFGDSDTDAADLSMVAAAGRRFNFVNGTPGDDDLVGTDGRDRFDLTDGGDDKASGGAGNDRFDLGQSYTLADQIDGGAGFDKAYLNIGPQSASQTMMIGPDSVHGIERLRLYSRGDDAVFVLRDGFADITVRHALSFDATTIDCSAITTGRIHLVARGYDETLIGGALDDRLRGNNGHPIFTGGAGNDTFLFKSYTDDTASITDFGEGDRIKLRDLGFDFHIGATPERKGDVTFAYDSSEDVTTVNIFANGDDNPDLVLSLNGDVSLEVRHDVYLVST